MLETGLKLEKFSNQNYYHFLGGMGVITAVFSSVPICRELLMKVVMCWQTAGRHFLNNKVGTGSREQVVALNVEVSLEM